MHKNSLPELLAPAGSMEALKAAVNAGADAVYISGKRFGARHYATNFEDEEIEDAVSYAHLHSVKVHVTVNTLIKDSELSDVAEYLLWLYKIGVDAVIIQDLGVADICRKIVPDLAMHASTQMTIHNFEGVKWAAEFGFKRVILAREVTTNEITEISKKLNESAKNSTKKLDIELEVFGHGALCYSYSGQCLMSSFIGGRSGNRGMCAQPCRKPYNLVIGEKDEFGRPTNTQIVPLKENYLMSTRDLSIYNHLNQISKANVNSIKVEGRMRSPQYVAVVVGIYRKALDSLKMGKWKPTEEDVSKLKLAFNRGFTKGYIINAHRGSVMARDGPGNRGLYIGDVVSYKKHGEAVIKIKNPLLPEKGDGIVFKALNPDERDQGMFVEEEPSRNKNKIVLKVQKPVKVGSKLFITRKKSLIDSANELINETSKRLTPIKISIKWDKDNVPYVDCEFKVADSKNIIAEHRPNHEILYKHLHYKAPFQFEAAIKRPLSHEQIEKQLKKTGGTPFIVEEVKMEYPGGLFVPIGKLNQLRRDLLDKVAEELLNYYIPKKEDLKAAENRFDDFLRDLKSSFKGAGESKPGSAELRPEHDPMNMKPSKIILGVYVDDLETLKAVCKKGCSHVYFEPYSTYSNLLNITPNEKDIKKYFKDILDLLKKAGTICRDMNVDLIWKLPNITPQSYLDNATFLINKLSDLNVYGVMVDGIGAAKLIKAQNSKIQVYGSAGLNVWNHLTVQQLASIENGLTGFKSLLISPELSKNEIKTLISNSRRTNSLRNIATSFESFELLVQGNIEAMVSEDCLPLVKPDKINDLKMIHSEKNDGKIEFIGIKDVKKRVFPINIDYNGKTHLLNAVELCLVDYMPLINNMGIDSVVIDTRGKTPKYASEMAAIYTEAIEKTFKRDGELKKTLGMLKNKIKKISTGGITTGNFIRGVK